MEVNGGGGIETATCLSFATLLLVNDANELSIPFAHVILEFGEPAFAYQS